MKRRIIALMVLCVMLFVAAIPANAVITEVPHVVGDADLDGMVTIMDATKIQKWLADLDDNSAVGQPCLSDINSYEGIELNFEVDLVNEEVSEGETYRIYDPDELTEEILCTRAESDVLIVERVIGQVTSGYDGKVLNTSDTYYNYISYKYSFLPIRDGTILVSYFIYNPMTNGEDDIVNRYDYILDRSFEH